MNSSRIAAIAVRQVIAQVAAEMRLAVGTAADITDNLRPFAEAYKTLVGVINDSRRLGLPGDGFKVRYAANKPWLDLMTRGAKIVEGILSTRSIPQASAKSLEMAYRLCTGSSRMPKDVYIWFAKNQRLLDTIAEAAVKWPEKQEGSDQLFKLGSFTVHNTLGISGPALDAFKKMLEVVIQKVKGNVVPGFTQVLYGDVYLVGQLKGATTAAWYNTQEDVVYCRLTKKNWGFDEGFALIHELGHRYLRKFANKAAIPAWNRHHRQLEGKPVEVSMPQVGDPLPLKIRGAPRGFRPVALRQTPDAYWYKRPDGSEGSISSMEIRKVQHANQAAGKKFPTAYSGHSAEEHFCEALALLSLGSLPEEHAIPFRAIWQ